MAGVDIPTKARGFWFGAVATIPSEWERDTDFDGRFLQGHATTAGTDAGGSHTHGSSHTHMGNAHTHTFSAGSGSGNTFDAQLDFFGLRAAQGTHTHSSATSNSTVITYANASVTTNGGTTDPPHVTAIVIKLKDAAVDLAYPDDAVALSDRTSVPSDWSAYSTLDGKFVKGAAAAADGGAASGSTTHGHTAANHTHSDNAHEHAAKQSGNTPTSARVLADVTRLYRSRAHHDVTLQSATPADVSTDAMTIDDATFEPAHTELLAIQNVSGGSDTPNSIILPFTGTTGEIDNDAGWYLCDGNNGTPDLTTSQVKATIIPGSVLATGGSNNHTHETQSHGHSHAGSHNHTGNQSGTYTVSSNTTGATAALDNTTGAHNHTWTVGATVPTIQNNTGFTTDAADGRAAYRTVLWIKLVPRTTVFIEGATIEGANIAAA